MPHLLHCFDVQPECIRQSLLGESRAHADSKGSGRQLEQSEPTRSVEMVEHGWADAWERAGGQYYPKLQVAVPFTPVPGPRLLGSRPQQLLAALEAVTVQNELSSAHITFIDEGGAAECERRGWLMRHGLQYHWFNRGYSSFDGFLETLKHSRRKTIRKERKAAREGLDFRALRGAEIGAPEWDAMWAFYQDTGGRKWGRPYLTRSFFDLIGERMGEQLLLFFACRDGQPVAGALNIIASDALIGRYWGCTEEVPFLHFELCYYQAIEWAIDHAAVEHEHRPGQLRGAFGIEQSELGRDVPVRDALMIAVRVGVVANDAQHDVVVRSGTVGRVGGRCVGDPQEDLAQLRTDVVVTHAELAFTVTEAARFELDFLGAVDVA